MNITLLIGFKLRRPSQKLVQGSVCIKFNTKLLILLLNNNIYTIKLFLYSRDNFYVCYEIIYLSINPSKAYTSGRVFNLFSLFFSFLVYNACHNL